MVSMNVHGMAGLALFLVGTTCAFGLSARDTLEDVPWQYMPETTLAAAAGLYNATFIPAAEQYLVLLDGVGDIQAQAYRTTGAGVSAPAAVGAQTPAVAAVAQWYATANGRINARLAP